MSLPGNGVACIVGAGDRHCDLDGFAAALEGILKQLVRRAVRLDELPEDTNVPLLLSSRIAPDAVLNDAAARFGREILPRCLPIGVTSQGAEIAVRRFGTTGGIELRAFATWSVDRTGFRGASGLICREDIAAALGLPVLRSYSGLIEAADFDRPRDPNRAAAAASCGLVGLTEWRAAVSAISRAPRSPLAPVPHGALSETVGQKGRCMRLSLRALSFMFVTMVALPAMAAEAGHVLRLVGAVEIERASGTTSLTVGAPIATGDRIMTGEDARVEIELEGGARLILGPESRLVVPEQAARAISVVDLLLGIVRATLPEGGTVSGFMVRGRTAVASVRSTEWIVETDDDNTAVLAIDADVQVIGTGGSVILTPGQGTDVAAGSAPTEPKEWGMERRSDVLARTAFP